MSATKTEAAERLPRPLAVFFLVSLACTAVSVGKLFWGRLSRGYFKLFEPLVPPSFGIDFSMYLDRMHLLHQASFLTYRGAPWMYPAPAAPLYWLLYRFSPAHHWFRGWLVLVALTLGICLFAIARLTRAAQRRPVGPFLLASFLMAWPIYLSLQRGNIESLLWLVLAGGIWAFGRGRWTLAAVLIGLVGAFKIYPLLCLGLFLPRKRWRQIAIGIAMSAAVTVISLWIICPDVVFTFRQISADVRMFTATYAAGLGRGAGIYDHSAFELVKVFGGATENNVQRWVQLYLLGAGTIMLALFVLRIRRMPFLNQLLFLFVACVFLPPASFDYALQSLYIPWAWIVLALCRRQHNDNTRAATVLMTIFALAFAPLTFISLGGVTLNGLAKGIVLVGLLAFTVIVPMDWTEPDAELNPMHPGEAHALPPVCA